jgi:ribonuclease P protein component
MPSVAADALPVVTRPQLWRITDRSTFVALRREGRRTRRGPLTLTWLRPQPGAPATPPRAGFAVGKSSGNAVVRNRIRRRLRAALRELQRSEGLPAGAYLLGAGPEMAHLPWSEVVSTVRDAVAAVTAEPTS